MIKKTLIIVFLIAGILAGFSLYIQYSSAKRSESGVAIMPSPKQEVTVEKSIPDAFEQKPIINILLIGTDTSLERRNNGQYGYNTDATILVSIDTMTKNVLLTSVPRDLWIGNGKINSLFVTYGWPGLKKAYEEVTGLEIDAYISTDFDGFEWFVTQMGGVDVEVKTSFADYSFPNRQDTDITTVSFEGGVEKMTGERALTYARSRKGTNGEGSDIMRAKRQHLVLQGIVESFDNPANIFWPMDMKGFFNIVTQHMDTNLTLKDATYLWDFFAYRKDYKIESFVLDDIFLYHPGVYPDSPYTAWVFVPRDPDYSDIHDAIQTKLSGEPLAQNIGGEQVTTE